MLQFDKEKLKATILYTCTLCEAAELGAVKMHKVLYFFDMLHYAQVGSPATGATYRKSAHGPTCDALLPMLREMEAAGEIRVREVDYFGYRKKEFHALTEPEIQRFSGAERALLDEVIDFVCRDNTAKTISDFSHGRAWEIAEFGEVIPYHSALHLFPDQVSLEAMDWASGEEAEIEAARQEGDPLGYPLFSDLRARVS
jgi:hypothetical protein